MSKFSFNVGATPAFGGGGGLFGSNNALTSTPAAGSTSTPNIFGTSTPATGTGFGQTAAKPSAFGATALTASPFGQQTAQPAASTGFGGFGATKPTTSLFGSATTQSPAPGQQAQASIFSLNQSTQQQQQQQQQQLQQQQQQNTSILGNQTVNTTTNLADVDVLSNAMTNASVYNDERDHILAKWNQLQAFYGHGKVFYQNQSIDLTKENGRYSRFKSISYNCKPSYKNEDGLVTLLMNQKKDKVKENQKQVTDTLLKIFNNDASLSIKVESIKSVGEQCELVFYVEQRTNPMTEEKTRVSATMVSNHLNKQEAAPVTSLLSTLKTNTNTIKSQLDAISVVSVYPLLGFTEDQIKKYLETPPLGFNPLLWDTAKKSNPNPKKLLPVQIIGFQEISKRFKQQAQENQGQKSTLVSINQKIEQLNARNKLIKAKIEQMKGSNEDLEQRVLKIIINLEIRRKIGIPIQDAEKYLLNVLDSFQVELNSPINKEIQRQRFTEFNENIRNIENSIQVKGKRQLEQQAAKQLNDLSNLGDVHQNLREQQRAFKSLIDIINADLKDLKLIKSNLGLTSCY